MVSSPDPGSSPAGGKWQKQISLLTGKNFKRLKLFAQRLATVYTCALDKGCE